MKLTAIVNENGELIAATTGPVEDAESSTGGAGTADVGGVALLPGQTTREIEVPDTVVENSDTEETLRLISDQLK